MTDTVMHMGWIDRAHGTRLLATAGTTTMTLIIATVIADLGTGGCR